MVRKVILCFGVFGGLRVNELHSLKFDCVKECADGEGFEVSFTPSKKGKIVEDKHYIIPINTDDPEICPASVFVKYREMCPNKTSTGPNCNLLTSYIYYLNFII